MRTGVPLVVLLLLPVAALAGCIASPAVQTTTLQGSIAPAIEAAGAEVTKVGDAAVATWKGTVDPAQPLSAVVDARWEVPITTESLAEMPFALPPDATMVEGALTTDAASGFLGFILTNATGVAWCGTLPGGDGCFATLHNHRSAPEAWKAVLISDPYAAQAGPATYALKLAFRSASLPALGPPAPFGQLAPLRFAAPVTVDASKWAVEPSLAVGQDGMVWVAALNGVPQGLWKSKDGRSFEPVDVGPLAACPTIAPVKFPPVTPLLRSGSGPEYSHIGCGDVDVAATGQGTVYYSYHDGAEGIAATHDDGATWFTNPFGTGPNIHTDRQWLATDGAATAWLAYDNLRPIQPGSALSKTIDGGMTWLQLGQIPQNLCVTGLARAPDGTLYVVGCDDQGPAVAVSSDGGLTFAWHTIAKRPVQDFFVKTATDAAGTVYAAWVESNKSGGTDILLTHSKDKGLTWSEPRAVNPEPGAYVYPWLTGGAAGHVAIAYYGTKQAVAPVNVSAPWYLLVALSEDASAAQPAWRTAAVSDQPVQVGPICLGGNGCVNGRNLGDFFQVQADKDGLLHVAYVTDPTANRLDARTMYAREVDGLTLGGPSVEKNGGR